MEFIFKDTSGLEEKELIEILDHNAKCAFLTKREIEKLKNATTSSNTKVSVVTTIEKPVVEKVEKEDVKFEEKVRVCFKKVKELPLEGIEENIYEALPNERDYDYEKVIRRVKLELVKEINDINEIVVADIDSISKEDLEELNSDINDFQRRIEALKEVLIEEKEEEVDEDIDNTLIFIPTASGNPRLFDDLDDIPVAFYDEFLELFMSIKDGSFKRAKRFNMNNKIKEMREVKGDHLRITYIKLGKNTYGLLTSFLKKEDTSHGYRSMLYTRYKDYKKNVEDKIKSKLNDEEFLKLHKDYEIEILRKLGVEAEKENQKVKKGNE